MLLEQDALDAAWRDEPHKATLLVDHRHTALPPCDRLKRSYLLVFVRPNHGVASV